MVARMRYMPPIEHQIEIIAQSCPSEIDTLLNLQFFKDFPSLYKVGTKAESILQNNTLPLLNSLLAISSPSPPTSLQMKTWKIENPKMI